MLYPHQVVGVRWLWSLHCLGRGGILADDMGLGEWGGAGVDVRLVCGCCVRVMCGWAASWLVTRAWVSGVGRGCCECVQLM